MSKGRNLGEKCWVLLGRDASLYDLVRQLRLSDRAFREYRQMVHLAHEAAYEKAQAGEPISMATRALVEQGGIA